MPPSKQPCGHEWKYNHKCGMGPEGEPVEFCCGCDAEEKLREIKRLKAEVERLKAERIPKQTVRPDFHLELETE